MATKYYALLTERGAAKLAAATALGTQVKITQMAVGDGGGSLPVPTATQTALIGEKRRAALNSLTVDPANVSQIIAEQVIPESEGGFWIREIGVFDDAGELIAIANCAETYKPVLAEGSGRTQVIRMVLIVSSTDAVTLKIDPSVVLATRKYVDDQTIIVKAYADDLMAKHLAATDPHTQYAPKASPTLTGIPKAPTATASNNSTQIATTAFVKTAIANLVASAPGALDTLNELATALGNDPNFATTITNALALKAPLASPALTGTPTAPTAAVGTDTPQLASTAFVQAAIAPALVKRGELPSADSLNKYGPVDPYIGLWGKSGSTGATIANGYPEDNARGILEVFPYGQSNGGQRFTVSASGRQYFRTLAGTWNGTDGPWSAWVDVAKTALQSAALTVGTNLNDLSTTVNLGLWRAPASATKALNYPYDSFIGTIQIVAGSGYGTQQYAMSTNGIQYMRYMTSATAWSDWFNLTGLSQVVGLPTDATSLSAPAYFSQSVTYAVTSTTVADFPVGATGIGVIMSVRRGANIMGLNQTLYTTSGTFERHGQPDAVSNWTSVAWHSGAGNDANGWRLIGMDAMASAGLGNASQTLLTSFDWQQVDFAAGANYLVNVPGWTNAPAGLLTPSTDVVNINVKLCRTNANLFVVQITSQASAGSNRYDYNVRINGAKGSRTFTVIQNFNNDPTTVVPIANGGTGSNTVTGALNALGLGQGSALPVGIPVPWPLATPPTGWLKCNGATFSAATYPGLATAYPTLKLPDLRGEFIRGWDDGRLVDTGRALLSSQGFAMEPTIGSATGFGTLSANGSSGALGFTPSTATQEKFGGTDDNKKFYDLYLDNRATAQTASETRPRNIALNYIVRAA